MNTQNIISGKNPHEILQSSCFPLFYVPKRSLELLNAISAYRFV